MSTYRVYCEDCDLEEVYDDEEPPQREISYYDGDEEKARRAWSAKSAAKGKYDNHRMSTLEPHSVHIDEI